MSTQESIACSFSLILVYSWTVLPCVPWFHVLGTRAAASQTLRPGCAVGQKEAPLHCVPATACPASASSRVRGTRGLLSLFQSWRESRCCQCPSASQEGWQMSSCPSSGRVDFDITAGSSFLFSRVFSWPGLSATPP